MRGNEFPVESQWNCMGWNSGGSLLGKDQLSMMRFQMCLVCWLPVVKRVSGY